ncbi:MAG: STAS domain-containing protein [Acidaminococcaceae bacterium]|nr:STAS domain-containing protein [Acidaminococcaceae bacterium]
MMDHTDEYNTQARTNPVFMTAKTAVCLMARAGIADSVIIRDRLGLQDDTPLQSMADADVILGNVLVVEAKYRTMCRLIEDSGYHVCVDLPCGYTPKALRMTEKGLRFVGLDLPIVAQEAGPILRSLAACPERMSFSGVDATNYHSLEAALQEIDEPLCISTEGMMMYFSEDEADAVISNISGLLEIHGGCWITPDPEYRLQFFHSFCSVFGESAFRKLETAGNAAKRQSDVGNLCNSFILDVPDVTGSCKAAEELLKKHGLKAEKVNLAEHMPELGIYRELTSKQVSRFKEAMRLCHYWVIAPDATQKHPARAETTGQKPFRMRYTCANGLFQLSLAGRVDSISAPKILMAWDAEKTSGVIDRIKIDCSGLEYISSAGIRVLLSIRDNCKRDILFYNVSQPIAKILAQNGFTEISL